MEDATSRDGIHGLDLCLLPSGTLSNYFPFRMFSIILYINIIFYCIFMLCPRHGFLSWCFINQIETVELLYCIILLFVLYCYMMVCSQEMLSICFDSRYLEVRVPQKQHVRSIGQWLSAGDVAVPLGSLRSLSRIVQDAM